MPVLPEDSDSATPADAGVDAAVDAALAAAVGEIEALVAGAGWDQPARLYALVDTDQLIANEPALAEAIGLSSDPAAGGLTAIEQDQLAPGQLLEQVLGEISWPDAVSGCAAMVERFVLPPGADVDVPDDVEAAQAFARDHPERQEVRMVAGATRAGATYCTLRLRSHDDDASVLRGVDLVPGLLSLLAGTLERPDHDDAGV